MAFTEKLKSIFKKSSEKKGEINYISLMSVEKKYEEEDYIGAARDLKALLEFYGRRKRKNHRYKGREFIYFVLSSKHKDLKNIGYYHWQNLTEFDKLTHGKAYPYHQNNLRKAIDFFEKEIKSLANMKLYE
mgnify:CR=1 FL=1